MIFFKQIKKIGFFLEMFGKISLVKTCLLIVYYYLPKKLVKNKELWQELEVLASVHIVTWKWVKGHAGNLENERADELATAEIKKIQK